MKKNKRVLRAMIKRNKQDTFEKDMKDMLQEFIDQGFIRAEDMPKTFLGEEEFAQEIYNIFQEIIDVEESITEEFTSNNSLKYHYKKHCLCGRSDRKSIKSKIYYDFDNINDYSTYEKYIANFADNTPQRINYLGDKKLIEKYFHKLFEGNQAVYLTNSCGFENKGESISVIIHAFASDKTQNYQLGNTVNFMIRKNAKTATMFPVDAHYLQTKLNNTIANIIKINMN